MSQKLVLVRLPLFFFTLPLSEYVAQVTGVTGFIAGHVALHFLEAGYRVRGSAGETNLRTV